ncbi:transposase [Streptacidiphilus sp. 4-A2]|nr:transposase [Streptacidiphilus sp. 4-A2]
MHTWKNRYLQGGLAALAERSHRPRACPHRTGTDIEAAVCEMRRQHPAWGPARLAFELGRKGIAPVPSQATLYRILVRNTLITPGQRRRPRSSYTRWQRDAPMQLWQMDLMGGVMLADDTELKLLSGIDDHSRFAVVAHLLPRACGRAVCTAFATALRRHGIPEEVLTDNGKQFTGRFTRPRPVEVLFERICRENGITTRNTAVRSPTPPAKSNAGTAPSARNSSPPTTPSPPGRPAPPIPGSPTTTPPAPPGPEHGHPVTAFHPTPTTDDRTRRTRPAQAARRPDPAPAPSAAPATRRPPNRRPERSSSPSLSRPAATSVSWANSSGWAAPRRHPAHHLGRRHHPARLRRHPPPQNPPLPLTPPAHPPTQPKRRPPARPAPSNALPAGPLPPDAVIEAHRTVNRAGCVALAAPSSASACPWPATASCCGSTHASSTSSPTASSDAPCPAP